MIASSTLTSAIIFSPCFFLSDASTKDIKMCTFFPCRDNFFGKSMLEGGEGESLCHRSHNLCGDLYIIICTKIFFNGIYTISLIITKKIEVEQSFFFNCYFKTVFVFLSSQEMNPITDILMNMNVSKD